MAQKKSGRQNYHNEPVTLSEPRNFDRMPRDVTSCANYKKLTHAGKALLLDALTLFTGQNNGDICLAHSLMKLRSWRCKSTLLRARRELMYYEFIVMTKRGINRKPDLFALAWINIHSCNGKHSAGRTTEPATRYMEERSMYAPRKKKRPPTIQKETVRVMTTGEIPERYHPEEAH